MLKDFRTQKFDVIVKAGQSNCEGWGYGDVAEPYVPDDKIWSLNGDQTICRAEEKACGNFIRGNLALSFAQKYAEEGFLHGDRKILIVEAAVGGTGFSDGRWGLQGDLYLHMLELLETALSLHNENRVVAFLWHQGETDALLNVSYRKHCENLLSLCKEIPRVCKNKQLPVIMGDLLPQWKQLNPKISKPVTEAMQTVCRQRENCFFVHTDGLLSNNQKMGADDRIHFCRESLYELGKRYFAAFKKAVSGPSCRLSEEGEQ